MAIERGNIATPRAIYSTSLSFPATISVGSNRILIVGLYIDHASPLDPTSITFKGSNLTKLISTFNPDGEYSDLWYLIAPDEGVGTITITYSVNKDILAGAVDYKGVHQTNPWVTSNGAVGTSYNVSVSLSPSEAGRAIDSLGFYNYPIPSVTPNSPQTLLWDIGWGGRRYQTSSEKEVSSGATTMSWTLGSSVSGWAIVAGVLRPAPVGVTWEKSIGDSSSVGDVLIKKELKDRTESLFASDIKSKIAIVPRIESFSLLDTKFLSFIKILLENSMFSDSLNKFMLLPRDETLSFLDSPSHYSIFLRTIGIEMIFSDLLSKLSLLSKSEELNFIDVFIKTVEYQRILFDGMILTDLLGIFRFLSLQDSLSSMDELLKIGTKSFPEQLLLEEILSREIFYLRSYGEILIIESLCSKIFSGSVANSITMVDLLSKKVLGTWMESILLLEGLDRSSRKAIAEGVILSPVLQYWRRFFFLYLFEKEPEVVFEGEG